MAADNQFTPGLTGDISYETKTAFDSAAKYFTTPLQQFQYFDKYARYNTELRRRETWVETVDRAVTFLHGLAGDRLASETYAQIRQGILDMQVMPSMRLLAMAGDAAVRNNVTIYNCAYLPVDNLQAFVEALHICMNGCGVGFSVESEYVQQLPPIRRQRNARKPAMVVADTTEGWADALRTGLETWFGGEDIEFDLSGVRPAGAPLLTKGGTASGPVPLRRTLELVRSRVLARQGAVLRPADAHDIMCAVGGLPIAGGVRPGTAMISLFDLDDDEMRVSKHGAFENENKQRWNANNSVVWRTTDIEKATFVGHMQDMVESGRGEPGIFNRLAAIDSRPERRSPDVFGTNPCGEVVLRPWQFCNLSSVVARPDDTAASLSEKVKLATIIGTVQSMATKFPGLRPQWTANCEEERLLGVDVSGQMDCVVVQQAGVQQHLRQVAVETNRITAAELGIARSAAITCVKPSGNSSQLVDCSSGVHARWAPYYIRNVRVSAHSPLFRILRDSGAPMDPENGQTESDAATWVIHFPVKSPDNTVCRNDRSAIEQCEYWLQTKTAWAEHNVSCTVTYNAGEVSELTEWVWAHRQLVQGLTFLPCEDIKYSQAPYIEISRATYERCIADFPDVEYSLLQRYEDRDSTGIAQEIACSGPACEI